MNPVIRVTTILLSCSSLSTLPSPQSLHFLDPFLSCFNFLSLSASFTSSPSFCWASQVRVSDSWSDRLIRASLHGCLDRRRRDALEMSYKAGLAGWTTRAGRASGSHLGWLCHEESRRFHIYWESGGGFLTFCPGGNPEALLHTQHTYMTFVCAHVHLTQCAEGVTASLGSDRSSQLKENRAKSENTFLSLNNEN